MKQLIFFTGICLFTIGLRAQDTTNQQQQLKLSFDQALTISLENNLGIQAQEKNESIKQQELKAKKGLFLPSVSLSASYINMSDDITMDLNPLKDAIVPLYSAMENYGVFSGVANPDPATNTLLPVLPDDISTQAVRDKIKAGREHIEASNWDEVIQKKNFGMANLNAVYPIYAGGKIRYANKAAAIRVDEAGNEIKLKQAEIVIELAERYYGLALAYEAKEVRQEVFENMKTHLNNAKHLQEEGIISSAELLHAKVYYSEAERELKKSQRIIEIANSGVLNTFSMKEEKNIIPESAIFVPTKIEALSFYLSGISNENQLLKKVIFKKDLVHIKHKVETGNLLPTIAAMGTLNLVQKDLSHMIPKYILGLSLTVPIFEGGAKYHELKASKYQIEQVDAIYQKVEHDLKTAITKYYQEMNMYFEEIQDFEVSSQFADEYYRIRKKAFEEGMATAAEVSDASLALAKVKIDRYKAMYNFDVALAKTLYYSGKISDFLQYAQ